MLVHNDDVLATDLATSSSGCWWRWCPLIDHGRQLTCSRSQQKHTKSSFMFSFFFSRRRQRWITLDKDHAIRIKHERFHHTTSSINNQNLASCLSFRLIQSSACQGAFDAISSVNKSQCYLYHAIIIFKSRELA